VGSASTYVYVLNLIDRNKFERMSSEEEMVMSEHFERLKRALADGVLVLAGPCLDGDFGIVVFRAKSEEEAKEFMENDPAVKHGIMIAELHPFHVSLIEDRQTSKRSRSLSKSGCTTKKRRIV
jgi:uncharacterized protein YciI